MDELALARVRDSIAIKRDHAVVEHRIACLALFGARLARPFSAYERTPAAVVGAAR
jgi:hypothetical protein